jgi:hypothetical protein
LAEVHGNRTHLGGYQPPTLDLKSRRPTSDLRTSSSRKIAKPLRNVNGLFCRGAAEQRCQAAGNRLQRGNGKRSGSGEGIRDERAVILLLIIHTHGRERQQAPHCLFPPGESARSPGNNCCRHPQGPCDQAAAFSAGTVPPRGSDGECPGGNRPEGVPCDPA